MAYKTIIKNTRGKGQFSSNKKNMISEKAPVFLGSAARYTDLPRPESLECCILGRSNVGKSSFINHVLGKKRLARVSKTPGKTDLANLYRIDDRMIWIDLPGYGYARASHKEKLRWSKLIRNYCEKRENVFGIIWLIDIRHVGQKADVEAWNWFRTLGLPAFTVITKSDKLPQSKRRRQVREIESFFQLAYPPAVYSIHEHSSRSDFWKRFTMWQENVEMKRS